MHFKEQTLSLRTGYKYMQLARNWSRLTAEHPEGLSSQRQALQALAAIGQGDESDPDSASLAARGRSGDATASEATALTPAFSQSESEKKRRRTGPVWRASGPFVKEALRLVRSLNDSLTDLIGKGFPLGAEAENVRAPLVRLQQMIDTDIDDCETQQARGEWTWVAEQPSRGRRAAPAIDAESEADHDD